MGLDQTSLSRFLSFVLRHRPEAIGLVLDDAGWVGVDELLRALAAHRGPVTREALEQLVRRSDNQRFALSEDGLRIRAQQGHSVPIELGYAPERPPSLLYHGTVERTLRSIRRDGLRRGRRHHVHLSETPEIARTVGARRGEPVILVVRAAAMASDGHVFYRTPNGVWLVDHVPASYLEIP
jgi:putative RNA 2'-phosphotransferase